MSLSAFFCTQLKGFKYFYLTQIFLFNSDQLIAHCLNSQTVLSGATTPDQSGPGSNGSEGVHCIPLNSKTGASPSDSLVSYLGYFLGGVLPLCWDAVDVFYCSSQLV